MRERPKFGHNPARERNEVWAHTILSAIDENMGTNLQAFYKHLYIGCLKTQQQLHFVNDKKKFNFLFFFPGQGACKSGRAQANTGRAQRPQKYA